MIAVREDIARGVRAGTAWSIRAGSDGPQLWHEVAGAVDELHDPTSPFLLDLPRLCALLEELDASHPPGPVLSVCVQVATVVPLLRRLATTSSWAAHVLGDLLAGEAIVALGATEEGISGDGLVHGVTRVDALSGAPRLNGAKAWITNATQCDYVLLLTRTREVAHFTSFGWFLIPAQLPGVAITSATESLLPGAGVGHLTFEGVALSPEHAVGRPHRALAELTHQLTAERVAGALWARSVCRRVLSRTYERLKNRSTGGGTLWERGAVRERFARCCVRYQALDALCERYLHTPVSPAAGMALKASFASTADWILRECTAFHGADAFADDGIAELSHHLQIFGVAGGSTGSMLAGVADHASELWGECR